MNIVRIATAILTTALPAPLFGQSILEVGPGHPFASIQAAVDAARPGDRILVHPGAAPGLLRVTKGVRITCSPRFPWLGTCVFESIPAGETASLSNADLVAPAGLPPFPPVVLVRNCAGTVSLERCGIYGPGLSVWPSCVLSTGPMLQATQSHVLLSNCSFWYFGACGSPTVVMDRSLVSLSDCGQVVASVQRNACHPYNWYEIGPGGPAVLMTGGLLTVANTSIFGSSGSQFQPYRGNAGILESLGEIHLAGPGTVGGGPGAVSGSIGVGDGGAGVDHTGALFIDQAVLQGGGATAPAQPGPAWAGPAPVRTAIPALRAPPAVLPGGTLHFHAFARASTLLYWALNFEALPIPFPGVHGMLVPRADSRLFVLGPVLVGAVGVETLDVAVPNDPALRGSTLFAQVAGIDPLAFPLAFFSVAVQGTIAF